MPRNPFTTTFDPRDQAHRTVREWTPPRTCWTARIQTWQGAARAYAKFHGAAKGLRADGSVVHYTCTTDGTVRQRTYTKVIMVRDLP